MGIRCWVAVVYDERKNIFNPNLKQNENERIKIGLKNVSMNNMLFLAVKRMVG